MSSTCLAPGDVEAFVAGIPPHEIRLLCGLDPAGLAEILAAGTGAARPVLLIGLDGPGGAEALIRSAIRDVAQAVAALWPFGWGGEDFSEARDDALTQAHLPIRLARLTARVPGLSQAWAHETVARMLGGRTPAETAPEIDWAQLVLALSPAGLVLATPLAAGDAARIGALTWLADRADVSVVVLAADLPDPAGPCGRILFGARRMSATVEPPAARPPDPVLPTPALLAPADVEGRPHPQSRAELRLYTLIQADPDLRPLFAFNRTVPDVTRIQARADLIWTTGRIVVEIDGPEHRRTAAYRADRRRDFELLCAGYRVLRLTNEDVEDDAGLALERIRDVVRLSRSEGPWVTT